MEGWVKIHRKLLAWEWYNDSNMVHLFLHFMLSANHKDAFWKGIPIKRGQLITGRKELSKQTGISEQSLRTCLNRLKSTREITIKPTNKYSIITICNYDTYQCSEILINQQINQQTNQQLTSNQPATNQQLTTNKNGNNENNNNNKNKSVFTPPLYDEVLKYFFKYFHKNKAIEFTDRFFYHHESRDWEKVRKWEPLADKAAKTWGLKDGAKRTIGPDGKLTEEEEQVLKGAW